MNARFKILAAGVVFALFVCIHPVSAESNAEFRSQWADVICRDLGCMSLGWGKWGVNLFAHGMVQDKTTLESLGFKFGEGPYRMRATRIDTGRYLVSLQSMSRPSDNQKKEIRLKTKADAVYPVRLPKAPEGEYTWNSAIQYDMEEQLGVIPVCEYDVEPRRFVDIRVQNPDKLGRFGFTGYKKNDTRCQLSYEGNNKWKFNHNVGALVYENGRWSSVAAMATPLSAAQPHPTQPPPTTENTLVFLPVQASDMTHNRNPIKWEVFRARINDSFYYLVRNPEIGTGLIDTVWRKMFDAESAEPLPGSKGMILNMDDVTELLSSGADLLVFKSKQTVNAWWEKNHLSFTVQDVPQVQTATQHQREPVQQLWEISDKKNRLSDPLLLFANSDFEMGDLTHWTPTGDAFLYQPTKGDNPTARGRKKMGSNHQGEFWIGTFEKYQGASKERPGQRQGDRPVGTLTSVAFEITGDRISFLIGGGRHVGKETVGLLVDGRQVFSETGRGNETMKRRVWDVTAYKGKQARIVIKDRHSGGWGHINADDFRYAGME